MKSFLYTDQFNLRVQTIITRFWKIVARQLSTANCQLYMKNIFFFLSFCFLLQSCGQSFLYEKDISLSNNTWTYDSQLDFPFEVTDTKSLQNLYLDITHSTEFKTQNLYVKFHTNRQVAKSFLMQFPQNQQKKTAFGLATVVENGVIYAFQFKAGLTSKNSEHTLYLSNNIHVQKH